MLKHPEDRRTASCPISTSAPSSRRATSSPARSTMRSSALGLDYVHLDISHRDAGLRAGALPQHLREAARRSASTSPRSRSRSSRRSITPAAAWSSTSTAAPTRRASMRPAKSPSRACTAPTASPPTPCSNASCSARPRRGTSSTHWDELADAAADPRLGRKPGHRQRRGSRHPADLGRDPPLHVEFRRHRPHHQAARARQAPDRHAAPGGRATITRHFRVTPDLIELRNLLEVADLIVRSALSPPRKPRAALHARLSRAGGRSGRHGAGALDRGARISRRRQRGGR